MKLLAALSIALFLVGCAGQAQIVYVTKTLPDGTVVQQTELGSMLDRAVSCMEKRTGTNIRNMTATELAAIGIDDPAAMFVIETLVGLLQAQQAANIAAGERRDALKSQVLSILDSHGCA